jgi:hypothetical protein
MSLDVQTFFDRKSIASNLNMRLEGEELYSTVYVDNLYV